MAPSEWPGLDGSGSEAEALLASLITGSLPQEDEACALVASVADALARMPTLVDVRAPDEATVHVVGDIHGQFPEFLRVLQLCGKPEPGLNYLLFNGDFVDRGPHSVEVMLVLCALVRDHPGCVLLNRGNHEARSMNRRYGFEGEVLRKYSRRAFDVFQEAFSALPLGVLVNGAVLVVHGGLPARDGVRLEDIRKIQRGPGEPRGGLAHDLLWADPSPSNGRQPSPRGGGIYVFGPDVTERFCRENGLLCVIRSHEVVDEGFEWQRGGRCVTVFSAANYVGQCGNLGAVCHIRPNGGRVTAESLTFTTFEAHDAGPLKPLRRSRL